MASRIERLKEFFQKRENLIFGGFLAPLVGGFIITHYQQSIAPPTIETKIRNCEVQLDNKDYPELVPICAPMKNNSLKEADAQTYESIGKIIYGVESWKKRKEKGTTKYSAELIDKKGMCPQLKEIDELWKEVSKGKLGFTAQRNIWNENNKKYVTFIKKVGWVSSEDTWKRKLSYNISDGNIPDGHLPALWNYKPTEPLSVSKQEYTTFFNIIEDCNL
jgi:GUN4-like